MVARRHVYRVLEQEGIRAQVVGPSHLCALWIEGKPYKTGIKTLRAARAVFTNYIKDLKK